MAFLRDERNEEDVQRRTRAEGEHGGPMKRQDSSHARKRGLEASGRTGESQRNEVGGANVQVEVAAPLVLGRHRSTAGRQSPLGGSSGGENLQRPARVADMSRSRRGLTEEPLLLVTES